MGRIKKSLSIIPVRIREFGPNWRQGCSLKGAVAEPFRGLTFGRDSVPTSEGEN